jgi:hypothetical protein
VIRDDLAEQGLTWVGRPLEVVRILDSVYLDQARNDFLGYVRGTLAVSQSLGGRFNPPGEFGALYTAGDEATAWEEVAARYRRQGFRLLLTASFASSTNPARTTFTPLDTSGW